MAVKGTVTFARHSTEGHITNQYFLKSLDSLSSIRIRRKNREGKFETASLQVKDRLSLEEIEEFRSHNRDIKVRVVNK